MGQAGSSVVNKISSSLNFGVTSTGGGDAHPTDSSLRAIARYGQLPLVYSRRGSMYFDEDGDLAHEFYEEVIPKKRGGLRKMKKIAKKNLVPQGEVKYQHPRLHVDFPIIMYQG